MRLHTSTRSSVLEVSAPAAWAVLACGQHGRRWYVDAAPLVFRATLDRLAGGPEPDDPPGRDLLEPGDDAGFWHVTRAGRDHRDLVLELEARVRAPGTTTLRSSLAQHAEGCRLVQSVSFRPRGLVGRAYLLADLPAREALLGLVHRRVCADIIETPGAGR